MLADIPETRTVLSLICPQCRARVQPGDASCPACGIDLAMAAALAERETLAALPAAPRAPYVADVILPRFGEFLLQNGHITTPQLEAALARQAELALGGRRQTIGQILFEMGAVTRDALDRASIQQIQELQSALRESNRLLDERLRERTRELQDALQSLTELSELKANFVSNISHELRTPLAKIKAAHGLLASEALGSISADQRDTLDVTTRGIEELERLVNDLIRFASTLTGEATLNLSPVSLAEVAERVLAVSEQKARRGEVRVRSTIGPALPPVAADVEKLQWVLFQLVDNAIKFTPPGGDVALDAEVRDTGVRVSVTDTGIGVNAERLGELFSPFHQLDGSTTRRRGGTGLGLALVKRIVEAHGCHVAVESGTARGSTFWFELRTHT